MAAQSGGGGTGSLGWGILAGTAVVVVVGAAALYLSGLRALDEGAPPNETQVEEVAQPVKPDTAAAKPVAAADDEPESTSDTGSESIPDAVADAPEPAAEEKAEAGDAPEPQPVTLPAPVLDVIRIDPDGSATLAGQAPGGSAVQVLLDGQALHEFEVDADGQFVVFLSIRPSDQARSLTLRASQDGRTALSGDYLIAPSPQPVVVAEASEPEPVTGVSTAEPERVSNSDPATETPADDDTPLDTPPASADRADQKAEPEDREPRVATLQGDADGAEQAPVILRSDEDGVALVQSPETAPSEDIALDTIGYSDEGEVQLSGRSGEGETVRVYVNNRPVGDLSIGSDGRWQGEVEGIDPGVYTLRLDELDSAGQVVSRLETPFKREAPELLRPAASEVAANAQAAPIRSITVQQGDTLWAISRERYGDGVLFVKVFDANRQAIRNPDLIYPGQIFTLPD